MSYKTILVHVDQSRHAAARIAIAAAIARTEGAHLIGVAATGISRFIYSSGAYTPADPMLTVHLDALRERARSTLGKFEEQARTAGVPSFESRMIEDEAAGGITEMGRYCDLLIIGQTDRDEPATGTMPDFPEYVLLNCARPVLLVPFTAVPGSATHRVLVAWDASPEATRAVTAAIPLLKRAEVVEVVVFNGDPGSGSIPLGSEPGADLALYLARHDIRVNVRQETTSLDTGNALLSLAADLSSDLIVMGGYGHSRFREVLLGGATRTLLASMTVPVLMAH
ncbi:MAG: universal stress protein [Herminiimonas sp.]|nr:universal stress protein [Herminiimonas sp.]